MSTCSFPCGSINYEELNNEECVIRSLVLVLCFIKKKDTGSFGRIMTPVFPNNNSLPILAVWDKRSGKATHTNLQILKPFHTCGTFKCRHVKDLLMNEVSYVPHWPLVFFHHKRFDIHSITNN
jgi:hypothetical protein